MAQNQSSVVVGVFEDREQAERAAEELRQAGFSDDQIGFAMRGGDPAAEGGEGEEGMSDDDERGGTREGLVMGAISGGALGGIVGAAAALLIPGIGPILAGGILGAALTGAAVGAATGGIVGALREWGVSEEEAQYYESELQAGRVLLTVRANGRHEEAREILRRNGAYDAGMRRGAAEYEPGATFGRTDEGAYAGAAQAGWTADRDTEGAQRIELREEELVPTKEAVQAGQVQLRKTVHEEEREIPVELRREEVTIDRRPADRPLGPGEAADVGDEVISVPVYEERADIRKEGRVAEEVVIGKDVMQEQQTLTGTVRREELDVDQAGDVEVRGDVDVRDTQRSGDLEDRSR